MPRHKRTTCPDTNTALVSGTAGVHVCRITKADTCFATWRRGRCRFGAAGGARPLLWWRRQYWRVEDAQRAARFIGRQLRVLASSWIHTAQPPFVHLGVVHMQVPSTERLKYGALGCSVMQRHLP